MPGAFEWKPIHTDLKFVYLIVCRHGCGEVWVRENSEEWWIRFFKRWRGDEDEEEFPIIPGMMVNDYNLRT